MVGYQPRALHEYDEEFLTGVPGLYVIFVKVDSGHRVVYECKVARIPFFAAFFIARFDCFYV